MLGRGRGPLVERRRWCCGGGEKAFSRQDAENAGDAEGDRKMILSQRTRGRMRRFPRAGGASWVIW